MTGCFCLVAGLLNASAQENNEYGLYLSPNLCLLSDQESSCDIDIKLRWRTHSTGNYCIHKLPQQPPLKCWTSQERGQLQVSFTLDDNLTLYLIESSSAKIVYRQTVRLQKQAKRYRRTRRNPWRFY